MTKEQTCKLTIYVARPTFFISDKDKRKRMNQSDDVRQRFAGHSFLGLTDENGVEKRIGFFAKFTVVGQENVPPEDVIRSPKDLFKRVAGILKEETDTKYHDAIEYKISKKQYDNALSYIDNWEKVGQTYGVLVNNCVSFATKTARKIGLRPPFQILAHLPTPLGTSLSIQLKQKLEEVTFLSKKIAKKLSNFFGGVGKVVELLSVKKTPENNAQKTKEINNKKVVDAIVINQKRQNSI